MSRINGNVKIHNSNTKLKDLICEHGIIEAKDMTTFLFGGKETHQEYLYTFKNKYVNLPTVLVSAISTKGHNHYGWTATYVTDLTNTHCNFKIVVDQQYSDLYVSFLIISND